MPLIISIGSPCTYCRARLVHGLHTLCEGQYGDTLEAHTADCVLVVCVWYTLLLSAFNLADCIAFCSAIVIHNTTTMQQQHEAE